MAIAVFSLKKAILLIIAGITPTFDTNCMCHHNSISFSCMIYKSHVPKMLFKYQYLKFAYGHIILKVSKMFRGNLTAGMLAIGVTEVLISEIDTYCHTISA